MDIDALEIYIRRLQQQVADLLEFKARVEPMLTAMLPEWQKFEDSRAPAAELGEGDGTDEPHEDADGVQAPAPEQGPSEPGTPVTDLQKEPEQEPDAQAPETVVDADQPKADDQAPPATDEGDQQPVPDAPQEPEAPKDEAPQAEPEADPKDAAEPLAEKPDDDPPPAAA